MINFDDYTNENIIEHNLKWPYIPDHPHRILIIGGSGSGKTNALLNLINNQPDIDKIHLYAKDPYEKKNQYLINKREKVGINHFNDPKAFMEYSHDMQDLIGSKIEDKITAKPSKKSHDDEVINGIPKERYISPKERQKIIDELRLT